MRRIALVAAASCTLGCRMTLDEEPVFRDAAAVDAAPDATSAACAAANEFTTLTQIKTEIFQRNCGFPGDDNCHTGHPDAEDLNLHATPHVALVGVASALSPSHKLVVPGQPNQSYLLYMIRSVPYDEMDPVATPEPPQRIGFMPDIALCHEKREAIRRWIVAGAPDN